MVHSRPGVQTGNQNGRSAPAEKAKEVEQGFQKPRVEPSAIGNCRWPTGRGATETERPTEGRDISGG